MWDLIFLDIVRNPFYALQLTLNSTIFKFWLFLQCNFISFAIVTSNRNCDVSSIESNISRVAVRVFVRHLFLIMNWPHRNVIWAKFPVIDTICNCKCGCLLINCEWMTGTIMIELIFQFSSFDVPNSYCPIPNARTAIAWGYFVA